MNRNARLFMVYKLKAKKWQGRYHSVPCLFLFPGKMYIKLRPRRRLSGGFCKPTFSPNKTYKKDIRNHRLPEPARRGGKKERTIIRQSL